MKTVGSTMLGDHIKVGDLIKANGCISLVLEIIAPGVTRPGQTTDRIRVLSDDGRCKTAGSVV